MIGHVPVLANEMVDALSVREGTYLDGTFGYGGYTKAILAANENANVIGIDRDQTVAQYASIVSDAYPNRFKFFNKKFSELKELLSTNNIQLDGAVFDLGVSSMQLCDPSRGFSFMHDSPLDMCMGRNTITAKDVVNRASRVELEKILLEFGEEYKFRQIAEKIVYYRQKSQINTTNELANIVKSVYKGKWDHKINPATKTFQAIRIYVNDELQEIREMLGCILQYLKVSGRLVIVSFHSLEDRIVKNYFRSCNKEQFLVLTKKPITAKQDEVRANPRSRSAKMRVIERVGL